MQQTTTYDHVDYGALDRFKSACIAASRRTLDFAAEYGSVANPSLGASANIFSLHATGRSQAMNVTLVAEGLGTADDARPDNLSPAELAQFWRNIGWKTVSALTTDVASGGLQPVLLSLYLPCADPEAVFTPEFTDGFLSGIVDACREVGCVYFSGETPQLKNKIHADKLDIAGSVFGMVPPGAQPIDASRMSEGDTIIFVESSGPHENGYTTLRKLAETLPHGYRTRLPSGIEYWQALNAPSILYAPLIRELQREAIGMTNVEPITGHGWQKLMRSARPFAYHIENMLPVPELFLFAEKALSLTPADMIKIFNYGAGLAVFVRDHASGQHVVEISKKMGCNACIAGRVEQADKRRVIVDPLGTMLSDEGFELKK